MAFGLIGCSSMTILATLLSGQRNKNQYFHNSKLILKMDTLQGNKVYYSEGVPILTDNRIHLQDIPHISRYGCTG